MKQALMTLTRAGLAAMLATAAIGCSKSLDDLKAQCENGNVRSCEAACDKGEAGPKGCLGAAQAKREGNGTDKDLRGSLGLAERACDGGDADGCRMASSMFERGEGADKHPLRAAELAEKGCDLGTFTLCFDASLKFALDPIKDVARAEELVEKGCKAEFFGKEPTPSMLKGSDCERARTSLRPKEEPEPAEPSSDEDPRAARDRALKEAQRAIDNSGEGDGSVWGR